MIADAVNPVANVATISHDPVLSSIALVSAAVVGVLAFAKPIMGLYREYKKTNADGVKSNAEVTLYQQLQLQITQNADAIGRLDEERTKWYERSIKLEREVERLKTFESIVESLREANHVKDVTITEREKEIRTLTTSMMALKDRIHALELRLARDEAKGSFCPICAGKKLNEINANS